MLRNSVSLNRRKPRGTHRGMCLEGETPRYFGDITGVGRHVEPIYAA